MVAFREKKPGRVSVFVGVSLDGFIARENGGLDFLDTAGGSAGGDHGYSAFVARIDALVMGRATFEKALSFDGWPYGKKPVIVLTHRPIRIPAKISKTVEAMAGSPREIVDRLARRGLARLYVDGGRTVQSFLSDGLVDELIVTRLPILIGSGIPLFGRLPGDVLLEHVETKTLVGGLVQSTYEVRPAASQGRLGRGQEG